jgi:hypothetical protein
VLAAENALLFRVMTNKAFTFASRLTRNGQKRGDLLARNQNLAKKNPRYGGCARILARQ